MYKTGDLVYIPSDVTLTQPINNETALTVSRFIKTERPTNALIVAPLDHSQYKVFVGGEHWYVSHSHVYPTGQEENDDSIC
jgi:hypothetical protein